MKSIVEKFGNPVLPICVRIHLEGSLGLLDTTAVVQFEFGGANVDTRTYFQDFWYLLTPMGFRLHRLGPRGLIEIGAYVEQDEFFTTTNYFAVRD